MGRYKLQTRTDCPSSDVILYSGRRTRHPYTTKLVYVSVSKKCTWNLRKRKFLPDCLKKFVRGRYVVLRRDSLKEGESCIVMFGINVSLFYNVINNLHKIRNNFLTLRRLMSYIYIYIYIYIWSTHS